MISLSDHDQYVHALVWALQHGVKAADYSVTGYWQCAGPDGREIMPPAVFHQALDEARNKALENIKRDAPTSNEQQ